MQDEEGRLGSAIQNALSIVGITDDRVSRFLGKPCGCEERVEKLNQLHAWAVRVFNGKTAKAREYLNEIIRG